MKTWFFSKISQLFQWFARELAAAQEAIRTAEYLDAEEQKWIKANRSAIMRQKAIAAFQNETITDKEAMNRIKFN